MNSILGLDFPFNFDPGRWRFINAESTYPSSRPSLQISRGTNTINTSPGRWSGANLLGKYHNLLGKYHNLLGKYRNLLGKFHILSIKVFHNSLPIANNILNYVSSLRSMLENLSC